MSKMTLARVQRANASMRMAQENARERCVQAWRELEVSVTAALGGEPLRGAPNLMPDAEQAFPAWRIHGNERAWIPRDGSPVLVALRTGILAVVQWEMSPHGPMAIWHRPAEQELKVEDFEAYARTIEAALQVHIDRSERSVRRYEAVEALAARLRQALV